MRWRAAFVMMGLAALVPRGSAAQSWTSTDVGAVGQPGSASENAGVWTVRGSGADIWGVSDAFQFVHQASNPNGAVIARVDDLQDTNTFAKAGVMVRDGLSAGAATAIVDLRPTGDVEFLVRASDGMPMAFVSSTAVTAPIWLQIAWSQAAVTAATSTDGENWTPLGSSNVTLPASPEVGLAVTSHADNVLTTAHIDGLGVTGRESNGWQSADIGTTGMAGSALESSGRWTVTGAGADIWGTADSFQFLHRADVGENRYLMARVDDLQNTNPFAKAGLMLRTGLEADAATVVLDVKPDGGVEFMVRQSAGAAMQYLGGTTVTLPAWVRLEWSGSGADTMVTGLVSEDKVHWTAAAPALAFTLPSSAYQVGLAVTSHDTSQLSTAHIHGLTLLPLAFANDEVGETGIPGSATYDATNPDTLAFTVEGAGSDIWGTADSFQFIHLTGIVVGHAMDARVVSIGSTSPFAKAGVMFRDVPAEGGALIQPDAASVVLDVKPDGSVEFMARECAGCETTFIATANVVLPASLVLLRTGSDTASDYTARVETAPGVFSTIGSVTVAMGNPTPGYAVTSHDPSHATTAVFTDEPAR